MNKICVYAICKNESKFVDKWLESMAEADYIVVLDTGSDDDTYELLKNDSRVYRVEQKEINPWRFDVARNESMKLIPSDANILLCTDLDEVLEPGWAAAIKKNWQDGFHVRGWYKYAWSHDANGEPGRIFYYDKLHSNDGWYWKAPVHEYLYNDKYNKEYEIKHTLNLFDKGVYLHHYPDYSKPRSSYLPLLELRTEEDENDYYGKYYLAHEYYYRGFYEKSIKTLEDILNNQKYKPYHTPLEIAACYLFIGDSYRAIGNKQLAIYNYNLAIASEPTYREPYIAAAQILNEDKKFYMSIGYIKECLNKTIRHYNWLERDSSWKEDIDDSLAISYFYLGENEKSLYHAERAYNFNNKSKRVINNYNIIKENIS